VEQRCLLLDLGVEMAVFGPAHLQSVAPLLPDSVPGHRRSVGQAELPVPELGHDRSVVLGELRALEVARLRSVRRVIGLVVLVLEIEPVHQISAGSEVEGRAAV
jgi:hypothetical protein